MEKFMLNPCDNVEVSFWAVGEAVAAARSSRMKESAS